MIVPEVNDVDISKLFNWGKGFSITDDNGKEITKIYVRLVGDAEINRARVHALHKSAQLRKSLKDLDSAERAAYIPEFDALDREKLINMMIISKTKGLASEAIKATDIKFPKQPHSDADLEAFEKYQAEVDAYEDKVQAEMHQYIEKRVSVERGRFESMSTEDLYKEYVVNTINELCEQEMFTAFQDSCIFFGSYKDSDFKVQAFTSIEEFSNLRREFKDQLIDAYNSLNLSMEDLKK